MMSCRRILSTVSMAALAAALCIPAAEAGRPKVRKAEAKRLVDPLNGFSIRVPAGWYAASPGPDALGGVSILLNHRPVRSDVEALASTGEHVKIEITSAHREGRTLDAWNAYHLQRIQADDTVRVAAKTSATRRLRLAGRPAVAFLVHPADQPAGLIFDVDWSGGRVLSTHVTPADSPLLEQVVELLDGMEALDGSNRRPRKSAPLVGAADEARAIVDSVEPLLQSIPADLDAIFGESHGVYCDGPAGTFDAGEAGTSPIPLRLPFASGSWEVGNIGSYYGNGKHCNGLDDYYATDWNRRTNSCGAGYQDDYGQELRPVANGTVFKAECLTGIGYGCQVLITHAGGIRTRYAHLKTYSVTSGSVTTATKIGELGCSGLGPDCPAHLHMSFLQDIGSSVYVSRCNGPSTQTHCPNGLDKKFPQTVKPSPMTTSAGSQNLTDGGCYTAGGTSSWSETVDDTAASFFGPPQYWTSVSGYGINNQMRYTWNEQTTQANYVQWSFNVPTAGMTTFQVYIPSNHATTTSARYYIHDGSAWRGPYVVNQNIRYNEWVTLATLSVAAGFRQIQVGDVTGEATGTTKVGVDAARAYR